MKIVVIVDTGLIGSKTVANQSNQETQVRVFIKNYFCLLVGSPPC